MADLSSPADPAASPVPPGEDDQPGGVPTPRLSTPATETTDDSVQREREAVGDGPDVGGLTPGDDAQ